MVLYAVDIPGKGGDTRYVNMRMAYDALDDDTKARIDKPRIDKLTAVQMPKTRSACSTAR